MPNWRPSSTAEVSALVRELESLRSANRGLTQRTVDLANANASASGFLASLEEAQERERRALADEHRLMTEELIRARDEAMEGNRAKSAFLTNMNHELRTPLHTIIGYSELLIEDCPNLQPDQIIQDLKKVLNAGVHLLGLINDVLDLARIEDGKMQLTATRFLVRPAIDAAVAAIQQVARERNNQVVVHCTASVSEIFTDEQRFRQVLTNLLSNAVKFTENGSISLHASTLLRNDVPHLLVSVTDTGIGIASSQMNQLFQPFAQADASTTRRHGGSGLGLAISRRLCQMMGGEIHVASTPGTGSIFSIMIPGVVLVPPGVHTPTPSPSPLPERNATILSVFGDPESGPRITQPLVQAGFRVLTAHSGDEARARARAQPTHLVTVDVTGPEINGWEVVAALKADPELTHLPVVLTATRGGLQPDRALAATHCFIKPVEWDRFETTLARYRKKVRDKRILVVDDDADACEIARRLLELGGWTVETAANGQEALDRLSRNIPSLIIIDLVMPVMDGFSLVERLKSQPPYRDIPIVVLSALSLAPEEHRRLNARIAAPPSPDDPLEDLMSTVHRFLG